MMLQRARTSSSIALLRSTPFLSRTFSVRRRFQLPKSSSSLTYYHNTNRQKEENNRINPNVFTEGRREYSSSSTWHARSRSSPRKPTVEDDAFLDLLKYDDDDHEDLLNEEEFDDAPKNNNKKVLDDTINKRKKKTTQESLPDVVDFSPHVRKVIVTCHPGLESVLCQELEELGIPYALHQSEELLGKHDSNVKSDKDSSKKQHPRKATKRMRKAGPAFPHVTLTPPVSLKTIMKLHLYLGSASRVQMQLFTEEGFSARALGELNRKIADLPWHQVLTRPPRPPRSSTAKQTPTRGSNTSTSDVNDAIKEPKGEDFFCRIKASASKSRLNHTGAIEERVVDGINQALTRKNKDPRMPFLLSTNKMENDFEGDESEFSSNEDGGPSPSKTKQPNKSHLSFALDVHLNNDTVHLWLDTSLTPLHQRGYRLATGKAPLREDMAYAMLYNVGWYPHFRNTTITDTNERESYHAFLDPFCGSGTLAIEACCMRAGLLPGRLRPPPLAGTRWAAPKLWKRLVKNHKSKASDIRQLAADNNNDVNVIADRRFPRIACSDRNEGAVDLVRGNAERAGVWNLMTMSHCAVSAHPWLQKLKKKHGMPSKEPEDSTYSQNGSEDDIIDNNHHLHPFQNERGLLIATNAPFGKRLSSTSRAKKAKDRSVPEMLSLFQSLSTSLDALDEQEHKYTAAILTNDINVLHRAFGGSVSASDVVTNLKFQHGGILAKSVVVTNDEDLDGRKE